MAEYATLEKTIRETIVKYPFTRIQGLPSWLQKTHLIEELEEGAMRCDVSYPWSGDYGLLAVVDGAVKYLARTGMVFVTPTKPTAQQPDILNGTAAQIKQKEAINNIWKRDYAIYIGLLGGRVRIGEIPSVPSTTNS